MTTAYPLAWPEGWPRRQPGSRLDGRSRFRRSDAKSWTFAAARDALVEEVGRLEAKDVVLSTNFRLTAAREPSLARGRPKDEGVALYFSRYGKPYVMACDRFERAEENMRSLALAIDALRQLERHGGGVMMKRAFAGFEALPPPAAASGRPWHQVLGLDPDASSLSIDDAYRRLAQTRHPDRGGSDEAMAELNAARDQARKARS